MSRMAEVAAGVRCGECGWGGTGDHECGRCDHGTPLMDRCPDCLTAVADVMNELQELRQRVDDLATTHRAVAGVVEWLIDHRHDEHPACIPMELLRGLMFATRR